jgi:hypothetical protein
MGMNLGNLGELMVDIGANVARLQRDAGKAVRVAKGMERKIKRFASSIGMALSGAFGVVSIVRFGKHVLDTADEVMKLGTQTGLTARFVSGLRHEASLAGVEFSGLDTSMTRLARNIQEGAQGMGAAKRAFDAMGISQRFLKIHANDLETVLLEMADRFSGYADGATKSALATMTMGRAGKAWIPILNQGGQALKKQISQGATMTAELGKQAELFNDTMAIITNNTLRIANVAMSSLLPHVQSWATEMAEVKGDTEKTREAFDGIGRVLSAVANISLSMMQAVKVGAAVITNSLWHLGRAIGLLKHVPDMLRGNFAGFTRAVFSITSETEKNFDKVGDDADALAERLAKTAKAIATIFAKSDDDEPYFEDWYEIGKDPKKLAAPVIVAADAAVKAAKMASNSLKITSTATGKMGEDVSAGLTKSGRMIAGWASRSADYIVDFVRTGKFAMNDLVESIMRDLVRLVAKQQMMRVFGGLLGIDLSGRGTKTTKGSVTSKAATSKAATGMAMAAGKVLAFAQGGAIVNRPTLFPMANDAGLMGEAGAEGIFPLERRGGKLGIRASGGGGGVLVQVLDQRGASAPEVAVSSSTSSMGDDVIRVLIRDEVSGGIADGAFDGAMGSSFGLRRRGAFR